MYFPSLLRHKTIALDTETTGLKYPTDKVFGFSISTPDQDFYYDLREIPRAGAWLADQLNKYRGKVVCHNASFDYRMLHATGVKFPVGLLDDTCIRACLIDENLSSYSLDFLLKKYLGIAKYSEVYDDLAKLFGGRATRNVQMPNLHRAPSDIVAPYAKADTRGALRLWQWQENEIQRQGIADIVDFERRVMPTIIRTEMAGIRVDLDYAEQAMDSLSARISDQELQLRSIVGVDLNVNSTPQIKKLFEPKQKDGRWWVGDCLIGSTESGEPSLNADSMRSLASAGDERADLIINIRSLLKTRDTFIGKHVLERATNGRVYPNINQNKTDYGGTATGRLSYTAPAMQQIPSRNKAVAAIVKPMFLPDEGQVWVDADQASFEVRIFAHLVNNPKIIDAYRQDPNLDFHQFTAELTNLPRNAAYSGQPNAKQLNLSMIFNSGNGAIAEKMGMPWSWSSFENDKGEIIEYKKPGEEARQVIDEYHQRVIGVKELANKASQVARNRGYVFTKYGRRLRFPDKRFCYKASGLLIQATAADINKENWLLIEEALGSNGRLVLNTHDSYSMSVDEDWQPHYHRVEEHIKKTHDRWVRVPLVLELSGVGSNWWEALQG